MASLKNLFSTKFFSFLGYLALQAAPSLVLAQITPKQVAAECSRQMSLGICFTRSNRASAIPGQTIILSGAGRVAMSAYLDYWDLYDPKESNNNAMCVLAFKFMVNNPGSDHDKIARALWTPKPILQREVK